MSESLWNVLKMLFAGTFGAPAGNFGYQISQPPSVSMVVTALVLIAALLPTVRWTVPRLRTHEWQIVVLWLAVGLAAELTLHGLGRYSFDRIIDSVNATGFYTVSQQYSAGELLSRHNELVHVLPTHARSNLPGKTLLFEALQALTGSRQIMGYLIVLLSSLGGVLLYLLAREWYEDRRTALYAFVLYLLLPARIYFLPILNIVSPCLLLLVFWFVTRYLAARRRTDLVFAGVSLYALILFDPLTLAAMPVLAALVVKEIVEGDLTWSGALAMVLWIVMAFTVAHVGMRLLFGFDLIEAFIFALEDARGFNLRANRPYSVWVVHNLKDFFLSAGVAQSAVLLASVVWAARRAMTGWRHALSSTEVVVALSFLLSLLVLDLSGANRGEIPRLWIFLGGLMQLVVARTCATSTHRHLFSWVLAISVLQTAICARIVLWVVLEAP